MTFEEAVTLLVNESEEEKNRKWYWGDKGIEITKELGSKAYTLALKESGLSVSSHRRYRDVAKATPKSLRKQFLDLSWTHFRIVAKYSLVEKLELLKKASEEQWSVEKLDMFVKGKIGEEDTRPPKPELIYCEKCQGWRIADDNRLCKNLPSCLE